MCHSEHLIVGRTLVRPQNDGLKSVPLMKNKFYAKQLALS
jgi:hypothetical protein